MASLFIDKELLRPDTVYYPPRSRPVSFSSDEIEQIFRASQEMLDSGRDVPVPAEHQDGALPMSQAERRAKQIADETIHNKGWTRKYYRDPKGSLWGRFEIRHPDAIEAIKSGLLKHMSPEIMPVFPADGKVYRNVITHNALTNKPVWKDQKPFYIPADWVGDDGAVHVVPARMSLLGGLQPLRLSLADAEPPEELIEVLRFGYRVPGGSGAWFRGKYYSSHVPKKALEEADPDEMRELLRKLSLRHARRIPKDFAAMYEPPASVAPYPMEVQQVPAAHLSMSDEFPPFAHEHPRGEPVLVWEHPGDGRTHVVSGHGLVSKLQNQEGAAVPVVKLDGVQPYQVRGSALMAHLLGGHAHEDDLAQFFQDGADPQELRAALKEHGHAPNENLLGRAEYLAHLRDDDPTAPKDMSAGPPAPALPDPSTSYMSPTPTATTSEPTLFSHPSDYDPQEHRWQHWLQSHFDDPAERAMFAAQHGKQRPSNHDDFLLRHADFTRNRMALTGPIGGEHMADFFEMTEPKAEEKSESKKEEKKEESPKSEAPKSEAPKASSGKFSSILKKLEKFGTKLDPEKIHSAEDLVDQLETVLHAMEAHADKGGAGAVPAGAPTLEPEPRSSDGLAMSLVQLQKDNEALKSALLQKDNEQSGMLNFCNKLTFSMIQKDLDNLQAKGQCTKAQRDGWLQEIAKIGDAQRFSLMQPDKSVEMSVVCAQIRMAKSIPEGTYLPKATPQQPVQMSTNGNGNGNGHTVGYLQQLLDNGNRFSHNGGTPASGSGATLVPESRPPAAAAAPTGDEVARIAADPEKKQQYEDIWKRMQMSLGLVN